jgi:hypothetical protein
MLIATSIVGTCFRPRFALRIFVCTTDVGASTAGKRVLAQGTVLAGIVISYGLWLILCLTYSYSVTVISM